MPLPASAPIPPGWGAHHQPVANLTLTGACVITRDTGEPGAWDPATGDVTAASSETVYTGPCRAQARTSDAAARDAAGQYVSTREYLVAIRLDTAPIRAGEHGDTVTITGCIDDPDLVGRRLRVIDVLHGTQVFQRDLICIDDLTVNNP